MWETTCKKPFSLALLNAVFRALNCNVAHAQTSIEVGTRCSSVDLWQESAVENALVHVAGIEHVQDLWCGAKQNAQ